MALEYPGGPTPNLVTPIVHTQTAAKNNPTPSGATSQRPEAVAEQLRAGSFSVDASGLHARFSSGSIHFTRDASLDGRPVADRQPGSLLMFRAADGTVVAVDRDSKCVYLCIELMRGGYRLEYAGALPLFRPAETPPSPQPSPTRNRTATATQPARRPVAAASEATETTTNPARAAWSSWRPITALRAHAQALVEGVGSFIDTRRVAIGRVAAALVVGSAMLIGLFSKRTPAPSESINPQSDGAHGQRHALVDPTPSASTPAPSVPTPSGPIARNESTPPEERVATVPTQAPRTESDTEPTPPETPMQVATIDDSPTTSPTVSTTDSPTVSPTVSLTVPTENSTTTERTAAEVVVRNSDPSDIEGAALTPLPEEVVAARQEAPTAPSGQLILADLIDDRDEEALNTLALRANQSQPLPIVSGPSFSELVSTADLQTLTAADIALNSSQLATATAQLPDSQGIALASLLSDEDLARLGERGLTLPAMPGSIVTTTRITMPIADLINDADRRAIANIALADSGARDDDLYPLSSRTVAQREEEPQ